MVNIFSDQCFSDIEDSELILSAQQGKRAALEKLILRHQPWIYNIAFRMVGNPNDAEDVMQEILIKMITRLSTFQQRSDFRTWLYRIVANHVIDMKKRPHEHRFSSFGDHKDMLDLMTEEEFPDDHSASADVNLLIEETRIGCLMGMLLCLDRIQRLVFILGGVLGIESGLGGDILEITADHFRQHLSRARKQLTNYMDGKCGLINTANPCRCARKTKVAIDRGYVNPKNLKFYQERIHRVETFATQRCRNVKIDDIMAWRTELIFQDSPFWELPDQTQLIRDLLNREEFRTLLEKG